MRSGRVPLSGLGLRKRKTIAYLFDFGDEWRLLLKVVDRWEAGEESYPMLFRRVLAELGDSSDEMVFRERP